MKENTRKPVIIMNFSGAYEAEPFASNPDFIHLDCTRIQGTDCYCSWEAAAKLQRLVAPYGAEGIHFIDTGDYHYLTKFWTDLIRQPFSLIVFDHHTDMQPSRIPGLLSCGNWVKVVVDHHPFLQRVFLLGTPEEAWSKIPSPYRAKVQLLDPTHIRKLLLSGTVIRTEEPAYISIDKDVLGPGATVTNWDQGSLTLGELKDTLYPLLREETVIGIDICGEYAMVKSLFEQQHAAWLDNRANSTLLQTAMDALKEKVPYCRDTKKGRTSSEIRP